MKIIKDIFFCIKLLIVIHLYVLIPFVCIEVAYAIHPLLVVCGGIVGVGLDILFICGLERICIKQ